MAQKWFGMDSLNLALKGDGNFPGFLNIMDDYKWTGAANLSHYYAGIIYLKQGKFQDAIDQLKDFNGKDKMVTNMAYGAMGDAYSELGKNDDAVLLQLGYSYKHLSEKITSTLPCFNPPCPENTEKYDFHLRRLSIMLGWSF